MNTTEKIPFEYCAIRYLEHYVKTDRDILESFRVGPNISDIRALLSKYKVSRSFEGIEDDKKAKFIVAAIVRETRSSRSDVEKVLSLARKLEEEFDKNTISAASKLLWAVYPESIVIYDAQTYRALAKETQSLKARDYESFVSAWCVGYENAESEIFAAAKELSRLPSKFTAAHSMPKKERSNVLGSSEFHRRVYDQFLWLNG